MLNMEKKQYLLALSMGALKILIFNPIFTHEEHQHSKREGKYSCPVTLPLQRKRRFLCYLVISRSTAPPFGQQLNCLVKTKHLCVTSYKETLWKLHWLSATLDKVPPVTPKRRCDCGKAAHWVQSQLGLESHFVTSFGVCDHTDKLSQSSQGHASNPTPNKNLYNKIIKHKK